MDAGRGITDDPMTTAQGLYDPRYERGACGVGFVAHRYGVASHEIVWQGVELLEHLAHRGAVGADPATGDGAGILLQLPHAFFTRMAAEAGIVLPEPGATRWECCFCPVR